MDSIGKSIGAIIRNSRGGYLLLYRLKIPQGLAMPAGHIDQGENPEGALWRELEEETGLEISRTKEVFHDLILDNPCRDGHKGHEWWVYEVEFVGEPMLREKKQHKFLKWMSPEEMRPYIERGETDPAWFKHILPALKII